MVYDYQVVRSIYYIIKLIIFKPFYIIKQTIILGMSKLFLLSLELRDMLVGTMFEDSIYYDNNLDIITIIESGIRENLLLTVDRGIVMDLPYPIKFTIDKYLDSRSVIDNINSYLDKHIFYKSEFAEKKSKVYITVGDLVVLLYSNKTAILTKNKLSNGLYDIIGNSTIDDIESCLESLKITQKHLSRSTDFRAFKNHNVNLENCIIDACKDYETKISFSSFGHNLIFEHDTLTFLVTYNDSNVTISNGYSNHVYNTTINTENIPFFLQSYVKYIQLYRKCFINRKLLESKGFYVTVKNVDALINNLSIYNNSVGKTVKYTIENIENYKHNKSVSIDYVSKIIDYLISGIYKHYDIYTLLDCLRLPMGKDNDYLKVSINNSELSIKYYSNIPDTIKILIDKGIYLQENTNNISNKLDYNHLIELCENTYYDEKQNIIYYTTDSCVYEYDFNKKQTKQIK